MVTPLTPYVTGLKVAAGFALCLLAVSYVKNASTVKEQGATITAQKMLLVKPPLM